MCGVGGDAVGVTRTAIGTFGPALGWMATLPVRPEPRRHGPRLRRRRLTGGDAACGICGASRVAFSHRAGTSRSTEAREPVRSALRQRHGASRACIHSSQAQYRTSVDGDVPAPWHTPSPEATTCGPRGRRDAWRGARRWNPSRRDVAIHQSSGIGSLCAATKAWRFALGLFSSALRAFASAHRKCSSARRWMATLPVRPGPRRHGTRLRRRRPPAGRAEGMRGAVRVGVTHRAGTSRSTKARESVRSALRQRHGASRLGFFLLPFARLHPLIASAVPHVGGWRHCPSGPDPGAMAHAFAGGVHVRATRKGMRGAARRRPFFVLSFFF
jgi:hypothetical protein